MTEQAPDKSGKSSQVPNQPVNSTISPVPGAIPEVIPVAHIAPETPAPSSQTDNTTAPVIEQIDEQIDSAADQVAETSATLVTPKPKPSSPIIKPTRHKNRKAAKSTKRKERFRLVTIASLLRSLSVTFAAAVMVATVFMWWTSPDFLSAKTKNNLASVEVTAKSIRTTRTPLPTPFWLKRIGVVAGHNGIATYGPTKGNPDPGATCPDGFTEAGVTMKVAQQVVATLRGLGYTVDLLDEYDLKLDNYQAGAFISIHAQTCDDYGYGGFTSGYSEVRTTSRSQDISLDDCIRSSYGAITGLEFQANNITDNITQYHSFHRIAPTTPGVLLELGFIGHDRDMLDHHTDKLAKGVVSGVRCFLEPQTSPPTDIPLPLQTQPTSPLVPTPTTIPTKPQSATLKP